MFSAIHRVIARKPRQYTLILSAGRTATQWLAVALNLHPKIFVSHGQDLAPVKGSSAEEYKQKSQNHFWAFDNFDWNDVDGYFDILEAQGKYQVYANIHGIASSDPALMPEKFVRNYRSIAMVRHPLHRVRSFIAKWNEQHESKPYDPNARAKVARLYFESAPELMEQTCAHYRLDRDDIDVIFFIHAVKTVFMFDGIYFGCNIPILVSELLTSDPKYFRNAFDLITGESVRASRRYLARVAKMAPIDRLNGPGTKESVKTFWKPWQLDHFDDHLIKSGLRPRYEELGYDLGK